MCVPVALQAFANPFMFFSSVSALYAARRANSTSRGGGSFGEHPNDGYILKPISGLETAGQRRTITMSTRTANTARFVVGQQWDMPSLGGDAIVAMMGSGGREIASRRALNPWFAGVLDLAAGNADLQDSPSVRFEDLRMAYRPAPDDGSPHRLLCARRGVMTSSKPRLFSSASDAWMFRQVRHCASVSKQ